MRNSRLLPYETIVQATSSEPEAVNLVLQHHRGYIRYFELYDPSNKYVSPYGDRMINSFCHAWNGTPSYFIRKYLDC